MEKDGVTRLYYHHQDPHRVREAWPKESDPDNWTLDDEAEKTYTRAEYFCVLVSAHNPEQHYFSVHPKNSKGPGDWFKIDLMGITWDEHYQVVAKALEKRDRKKGLTIIIY